MDVTNWAEMAFSAKVKIKQSSLHYKLEHAYFIEEKIKFWRSEVTEVES